MKLNRMLDSWNTDGKLVWTVNFQQYNIVPNLQPQTIGPGQGATYFAAQRPVKIVNANIILNPNTNNAIRQPLNLRDADWWANKRAFAVQGTLPTDLYYEPDWPNGSLYLWIVPTIAYLLELETWTVLSQLQLNSAFCLPPGYLDAVIYSLAEALCPSFAMPWTPGLEALKKVALRRIEGLNTASPLLQTSDFGVPKTRGMRSTFNYLTGLSNQK